MRTSGKKIMDQYQEGRITATGVVLRILELADRQEMREAIEVLPTDLLGKLRGFIERYRPDMLIFPGPPPNPGAVQMAREVLAEPVKAGS